MGCCPWGHTDSDTIEATEHAFIHACNAERISAMGIACSTISLNYSSSQGQNEPGIQSKTFCLSSLAREVQEIIGRK